MNKYADNIELITKVQAGFSKGYSTVDNIFILHSLISIYLPSGKKLHCTFVDFKKAFDTVWRLGLWQKLMKSKISGKIFKVIYNLYNDTKSCICHSGKTSEFFPCGIGSSRCKPFPFLICLIFERFRGILKDKQYFKKWKN